MLESLISIKEVNKKPYLMFFWALLISTIGILISNELSFETGLMSVVFTVIPSVYFVTYLIKIEEKKEEEEIKKHYEKMFWKRHEKDILFLLYYFFGLTLSFAFWAFVLPDSFFDIQINTVTQIHGMIINLGLFEVILFNNLKVMLVCFILSLLFGTGAVFIIAWNASVLGVYIGSLSKSIFHIPIVTLSFLPHGIPEICGYLCAGLAGGILSAAIMRGHNKKILKIIFIDSLKILFLGAILILLGAGIEACL